MKLERTSRWSVIASFAAVLLVQTSAVAAKDVLAPFFEKVKDKGFPVAARAPKDAAVEIDVYAKGVLTRYTFDKKGKIKAAPCSTKYNLTAIKAARFSAANAAAATKGKADPREAEIRGVLFSSTGKQGLYMVLTYDKNGKYFGRHLFSADGRWDGFDAGLGEEDPLKPRAKR